MHKQQSKKGGCMKKIIGCLLAVLFASAVQAESVRAGKRYESKTVQIPSFQSVVVADDIEVDFAQRAPQSAVISGASNLVALVDLHVQDETLTVSFSRPVKVRGENRLKVFLTAPKLSQVTVSNKGELEVQGLLEVTELQVYASQNGDFSADSVKTDSLLVRASDRAEVNIERLSAKTVKAVASGRADIELGGSAEDIYLENNGSGSIDAEDLRTATATAVNNTNGEVKVFALQKLTAEANGRGRIEYKGFPKELTPRGRTSKIVQEIDD